MSQISDTFPQRTDLFGHPRGLTYLFTTEIFSHFSMMSTVLVLYMVEYLFVPGHVESVFGYTAVKGALEFFAGPLSTQMLASSIYGLYTGLVYLTPLLGGLLADRVFGQRATVVIGIVLMLVGQLILMFESLFFLGLLALILGYGAFRPNTLTQVGALYARGDARRDRAFLIVLVAINVGAAFATLVSSTLAVELGWHYCFAAASIGMLIALMVYLAALPTLPIDELHKAKAAVVEKMPLAPKERRAVLALLMLFLAVTLFYATYEPRGTFALWTTEHLRVTLFLTPILATTSIFVFPLLVIRLWAWQGKHSSEPSSIAKMAIGCFCLALAYLVLTIAAWQAGEGEVGWLWQIAFFVLGALGELYVWPTGFSLVSQFAPARMVSLMMGLCLATNFTGNVTAGWLGGYWSALGPANFFFLMAALASAAGVVGALLIRPLKSIVDRPAIG